MMGLALYSSEGRSVYEEDKVQFLTEVRDGHVGLDTLFSYVGDLPAPEYIHKERVKSRGVAYYISGNVKKTLFYDNITSTPVSVGPKPTYGLQTWDENGRLILTPERRPLQPFNLRKIQGIFSNMGGYGGETRTTSYLIGPAQGNAVFLTSFESYQYFYMGVDEMWGGGTTITSSIIYTVRVSGGDYFLDVTGHYRYSDITTQGGEHKRSNMPYQAVVGLVKYTHN